MTLIKDITITEGVEFHIYTDESNWYYIADEDGTVIADEDSLEDCMSLLNNLI